MSSSLYWSFQVNQPRRLCVLCRSTGKTTQCGLMRQIATSVFESSDLISASSHDRSDLWSKRVWTSCLTQSALWPRPQVRISDCTFKFKMSSCWNFQIDLPYCDFTNLWKRRSGNNSVPRLFCPRVQIRRCKIRKGQLWSQHNAKRWVQTCCASTSHVKLFFLARGIQACVQDGHFKLVAHSAVRLFISHPIHSDFFFFVIVSDQRWDGKVHFTERQGPLFVLLHAA